MLMTALHSICAYFESFAISSGSLTIKCHVATIKNNEQVSNHQQFNGLFSRCSG